MSGMDVLAAIGFVISVWAAYDFGVASERERADRRAQAAADRAAHRAATSGVTHIHTRRRA